MAIHSASLVPVLAMNPLMTFDHTNPFSTYNTESRPKLKEYTVVQIPLDYTRLEAQLLTPMITIAHERQFVTAQLGHNNDSFEAQHTAAIAGFIAMQDRVLAPVSEAFHEMEYLLSFSAPVGTSYDPAARSLPLVIDLEPALLPSKQIRASSGATGLVGVGAFSASTSTTKGLPYSEAISVDSSQSPAGSSPRFPLDEVLQHVPQKVVSRQSRVAHSLKQRRHDSQDQAPSKKEHGLLKRRRSASFDDCTRQEDAEKRSRVDRRESEGFHKHRMRPRFDSGDDFDEALDVEVQEEDLVGSEKVG